MAVTEQQAIDARKKYVEAWNNTMIDIWLDRIKLLGVIDTGALAQSLTALAVKSDGRIMDVTLSQTFLEYDLWQDLGVGRETPIGNPGDIGREKVRERRRWFSTKYFTSVMRLKEFFAESLGDEFVGILAGLNAENYRKSSAYYQRKGLS